MMTLAKTKPDHCEAQPLALMAVNLSEGLHKSA
jgi:hypothetical protein